MQLFPHKVKKKIPASVFTVPLSLTFCTSTPLPTILTSPHPMAVSSAPGAHASASRRKEEHFLLSLLK